MLPPPKGPPNFCQDCAESDTIAVKNKKRRRRRFKFMVYLICVTDSKDKCSKVKYILLNSAIIIPYMTNFCKTNFKQLPFAFSIRRLEKFVSNKNPPAPASLVQLLQFYPDNPPDATPHAPAPDKAHVQTPPPVTAHCRPPGRN